MEGCGLLLPLSADVGPDGGVSEPVECGAEAKVMLASGRAADRFEQVVGVEVDYAARRQSTVEGFGDLCRSPDEDVSIPDRRESKFRVGANFHPDIADMILDRGESWLLGQAEERAFHCVALVAD